MAAQASKTKRKAPRDCIASFVCFFPWKGNLPTITFHKLSPLSSVASLLLCSPSCTLPAAPRPPQTWSPASAPCSAPPPPPPPPLALLLAHTTSTSHRGFSPIACAASLLVWPLFAFLQPTSRPIHKNTEETHAACSQDIYFVHRCHRTKPDRWNGHSAVRAYASRQTQTPLHKIPEINSTDAGNRKTLS